MIYLGIMEEKKPDNEKRRINTRRIHKKYFNWPVRFENSLYTPNIIILLIIEKKKIIISIINLR